MRDTIFALATAPGRAAVALMRLSGPQAGPALDALAGGRPAPRRAGLRRLRAGGEVLDDALVLWFPAPASFSGEDMAELHLHGGAATVGAVSQALAELGVRPADPGEFTRRAFENGKLELSQAEAIADLVEAETAAQRRQALSQLEGALAAKYERWRETLTDGLALLEAEIDFPDEGLPPELVAKAKAPLERLAAELEQAAGDLRGERVREGYRVALVGAPNAGKSSLLNALVGREAAIVTPIPGTTRDVIEAHLVVEGYRVLTADMAGVRGTADPIEAEGVRRARAWAEAADLRMWVVDASAEVGAWAEAKDLVREGDLLVLNKADLARGADARAARPYAEAAGASVIETSAVGGAPELGAWLRERVSRELSGGEFPAATRVRHRRMIGEALAHLKRGLAGLGGGAELAAEDLRLSARALERLSGRIDAEAILARVFASFCIGK